jgi:hypothetical protein
METADVTGNTMFECATKQSNSTLCVTIQHININNVLTKFLQLMKYFQSCTLAVLFNTLLYRLPLFIYIQLA